MKFTNRLVALTLATLMAIEGYFLLREDSPFVAMAENPTVVADIEEEKDVLLPCQKLDSKGNTVEGIPCDSIEILEILNPMQYNVNNPNQLGWTFIKMKNGNYVYITQEGTEVHLYYRQTTDNKGNIIKAIGDSLSYEIPGNFENGFVSYAFIIDFFNGNEQLLRGVWQRGDKNYIDLPLGTIEELYHAYLRFGAKEEGFNTIFDFAASLQADRPKGDKLSNMDRDDFLDQLYEHLETLELQDPKAKAALFATYAEVDALKINPDTRPSPNQGVMALPSTNPLSYELPLPEATPKMASLKAKGTMAR